MPGPLAVVKAAVESINAGDLEKALEFYADDVRQRSPDPQGPGLRERVGKDVLRQVMSADRDRGVRFLYTRFVCQGNTVAAEAVNVGCFNGREIRQPVAVFYEVENERISSVTVYYDRFGLRRAIDEGDA